MIKDETFYISLIALILPTLYTMTKVRIFNKSNDVSRFDIFIKFFEYINSKISLTCCTETGAVYQNVLDCERKMVNLTFRLIISPYDMQVTPVDPNFVKLYTL